LAKRGRGANRKKGQGVLEVLLGGDGLACGLEFQGEVSNEPHELPRFRVE